MLHKKQDIKFKDDLNFGFIIILSNNLEKSEKGQNIGPFCH
jgi:hypothetical protein